MSGTDPITLNLNNIPPLLYQERIKMRVAKIIEEKLNDAFSPAKLTVIDESHLHAGHAGARPEGESHFRVEIVSNSFEGMSRVAQQRAVYQVLAQEMASDIHALALDIKSSEG